MFVHYRTGVLKSLRVFVLFVSQTHHAEMVASELFTDKDLYYFLLTFVWRYVPLNLGVIWTVIFLLQQVGYTSEKVENHCTKPIRMEISLSIYILSF